MHVPPLEKPRGQWARSDEEKAELFAQHLATVFQPNEMSSNIDMAVNMLPEQAIKLVTPKEIRWEIDRNMNPRMK